MKKTLQTTARGWVDGSTQTLAAQIFRTVAALVATPYSGVVRLRNRLYDVGLFRASRAPRPTISVGNLTLGGVGKTPFVGWLADYFLQTAQTPAFISRGYQAERQRDLFARLDADDRAPSRSDCARRDDETAQSPRLPQSPQLPLTSPSPQTSDFASAVPADFAQFQHFNDEARELALLFPQTPHFLGSNRVEVASALVAARPDVDVLLLDDAFQHRRIKRDLDVVLLDALNPFGGGRVFPAGFLREPIAGLARADVVLLNRADLIADERRRAIRAKVERVNPDALFAEIAQIPRFIFSRNAASSPIDATNATNATGATNATNATDATNATGATNATADNLPDGPNAAFPLFSPPCPSCLVREEFATWSPTRRGGRFLAFCGLGAPNGFRKTLETNDLAPASFIAFPDHHAYSARDLEALAAEAERVEAEALLTTAKDFVKLSEPTLGERPIFALGVGIAFLSGESELRALLSERFPPRR